MGNQSWRPCWRLGKEGQSGEGTGDPSLSVEVGHRQQRGNGVSGEGCGKQPHTRQSRGCVGGEGHHGLCLLGHPDSQSWKWNRASLRLGFMLAQPAKNLPLVLPAPAAAQKPLELSVLG